MIELIKAAILGIVQGLTEFIPVSSSAHLVIAPWLFGWKPPSLLFDTMLHWGTLLSLLVVFWRDFWVIAVAVVQSIWRRSLADPNARLGWFIVAGSIPAAVAGLFFKDFIESLFASPLAAGLFLLVTAFFLWGSEQLAARQRNPRTLGQLTWMDTLVVGVMQAVALAPGISRSGSTIAAGLVRNVRRDEAARFSFFLGTPAFLGAGLLQLVDVLRSDAGLATSELPMLALGLIVAAVTGLLAIRFLLNYLRTRTLYPFAIYCVCVSLLVIVVTLLRG